MQLPDVAAAVAEVGRSIWATLGIPDDDTMWEQIGTEIAEDAALHLNAAAVMADASQDIGTPRQWNC